MSVLIAAELYMYIYVYLQTGLCLLHGLHWDMVPLGLGLDMDDAYT